MTKPMIGCDEVLEHLFEYLDRELDQETAAEIEHHLEHCRSCFSRAEFERRLKARVRNASSSPASERLRARIKEIVEKF